MTTGGPARRRTSAPIGKIVWIPVGAGVVLLIVVAILLRSPLSPEPGQKPPAVSEMPKPPPVASPKPPVPAAPHPVKPPPPAYPENLTAQGIKAYLDAGGNPNVRNAKGLPLLVCVVMDGDAKGVALLLRAGAEIEAVSRVSGDTALHTAVILEKVEMVKLLLDKGASIKATSQHGRTVLESWLATANPALLKLLVAAGVDVNAPGSGRPALFAAARADYVDAIKLLVAAGANVRIEARDDQATPLHVAAYEGHVKAIGALLDAEADIEAVMEGGRTPLQVAVLESAPGAVRLLLLRGANASRAFNEALDAENPEIAKLVIEKCKEVDLPDENGDTPLHRMVRKGKLEVVKVLLEKKADVKSVNEHKLTPFGVAICAWNREAMKLLAEKGADVNVIGSDPKEEKKRYDLMMAKDRDREKVQKLSDDYLDAYSVTALHRAVREKDKEMAAWLLDHGADTEVRLKLGSRPIEMAISSGQEEMVELLLAKGAKIETAPELSDSPLFYAVKYGTPRMVEMLLAKGAKMAPPDARSRRTALHEAAKAGKREMVELMIAKGADVNARASDDTRPLHEAAKAGHAEVVELLLSKGAKFDLRATYEKKTALFMAVEGKHADVVEILLKKGADPNIKDDSNESPLRWAVRSGDAEIAELLRKHGAKEASK